MTHYTCPACDGVSESPNVCVTDGCAMAGLPLKQCACDDNQHKEIENESLPQ